MHDKDNYLRAAELATGQGNNMIGGILDNAPPLAPPVPVPYVKPLDKVKERTQRKRNRAREER